MSLKMLKGDEVYSSITVGDQKTEYGGARKGSFFYLISIGDRNGTCSPEFRDAFRAGKIDSMSYSETEYQPVDRITKEPRKDPITGDVMPKRPSLSIGSYETIDQRINRLKGSKELFVAEAELTATKKVAGKIAERKAYSEAGIEKEEMLELMALA